MEQLANNIRHFRKYYKWTQDELAEKLSVSRSVITKWETNIEIPDAVALGKLSDVFDIPSDYLIGSKSFQKHLLKDVTTYYQIDSEEIDEPFMELVEFILTNPELKENVSLLRQLPVKKQHSLQRVFRKLLEEYIQL